MKLQLNFEGLSEKISVEPLFFPPCPYSIAVGYVVAAEREMRL